MRQLILVLGCFPFISISQNIDHWETVIFDNDTWKYLEGTYEPDSNWRKFSFNDSEWFEGQGGIGYGDGDDNTEINPVTSLYLRKKFSIIDATEIEAAILHIDYDDAFVAYLNNVEIARSSNIGSIGDYPKYSQVSSSYKEAQMYQGGKPSQFIINQQLLDTVLNQGSNVLSVQVHNDTITSSDLTSRIFLSLGIDTATNNYSPTPSWFIIPGVFFQQSNLPIVVINTNGQTIQDEPRIVCSMGIIDNGENINSINDAYNDYDGLISIEYRGYSSQAFLKKSYSLETQDIYGENNNVPLLGMPEENDWILYAPYEDNSFLRNALTYHLYSKMGYYSPRFKFCNLLVNNEYKGMYLLIEKIKRDKNRIDINELGSVFDNTEDISGGYILEIDRFNDNKEKYWTSSFTSNEGDSIFFHYKYPKWDNINDNQKEYIQDFIYNFEYAIIDNNFSTLYKDLINVGSFIDYFIISELSKNIDAYRASTFLYKNNDNIDKRLNIGPVWDFNYAYGNTSWCQADIVSGWELNTSPCGTSSPVWYYNFLSDTLFNDFLNCRWTDLRNNVLSIHNINLFIDSLSFQYQYEINRDLIHWNNKEMRDIGIESTAFNKQKEYLKNWISERIDWLDVNIPGEENNNISCYQSDYEYNESANLILKTDILGRKINKTINSIMLYIYDDGTVEKKIIIE